MRVKGVGGEGYCCSAHLNFFWFPSAVIENVLPKLVEMR
jgi:hypothetical protein